MTDFATTETAPATALSDRPDVLRFLVPLYPRARRPFAIEGARVVVGRAGGAAELSVDDPRMSRAHFEVKRACAAELPAGARHTVTDLSGEMVRRAGGRLGPNVEVLACDAATLPFEDGAFDRALMNLMLMLTPDPSAVLAEVRRVLGPGGRLAFSVWGRAEHSPAFTLPPAAATRLGFETTGQALDNFWLGQREALIGRVRGHGFAQVRAWYQPLAMPIRDGATYVAVMLASPRMAAFTDAMPAPARDAYVRTLTELADALLAEGHPLSLDILVVTAEVAAPDR